MTTVKVKGMHCTACEALLKDVLEEAGATAVTANYKTGILEIEHPDTLSIEKIQSLLKEEGYEVVA